MSDFHLFLRTLQGEIWEAGPAPTPTLEAMLTCLSAAPPPQGIVRLPTARMAPGPHLAPQEPGIAAPDRELDAQGVPAVGLQTRA